MLADQFAKSRKEPRVSTSTRGNTKETSAGVLVTTHPESPTARWFHLMTAFSCDLLLACFLMVLKFNRAWPTANLSRPHPPSAQTLQSALPKVLQANQGTCRPSLSSKKLAMLDHVHLFFQKRHKSHVFKCVGYSCSATCASSPAKAAS